jgi:adenylate cyclase
MGETIFRGYFRNRLLKPLFLGFVIAIVGVLINIAPFGLDLEENFGLAFLFWLRGISQPPNDVVIVSVDKESADALKLPDDPRKWPRSAHKRLIDELHSQGAAVIAFDMTFAEKQSPREDGLFADALRKAHNAVLCENITVDNFHLKEVSGFRPGEVNITKVQAPATLLLESAAASAPFPVPKSSNKVTQYWTFLAVGADKPTLPVVAFQIYAMQVYDDFLMLLKRASPNDAKNLPTDADEIIKNRGIEKLMRDLRHIFRDNPSVAEKMRKELRNEKALVSNSKKYKMIASLIKVYADKDNSEYLNFYGPARTIRTIPYYRIIGDNDKSSTARPDFDIKGKAVFVGLSELSPFDQRESFYTVYSENRGSDLSGVEIVATAFANLSENMPIEPLDFRLYLALIFFFGAACGFISKRFSTVVSFYSMFGLISAYLIFAVFAFKHIGIWYPLITSAVLMSATSLFCGLLWNYAEVKRERQNIRKALGFYLPDAVADQLTHNIEGFHSTHQIVFGICLSTDAEQYSSLAEAMDPKELGSFMNRYYEIIFEPIKQHQGIVSDVIGDSVLAIWISPHSEKMLKHRACMAALDISQAIQRFNEESEKFRLPTRIGLHSGNILIGNIGAIDHYEYRPMGDIVNTASRIEGLNKYLRTRILVTEEVIDHLEECFTRKIGEFKLAGKTKPVTIHELVCRLEDRDERQMRAYAVFADALSAFTRRSWDEAINGFQKTIEILGEDGPASFYIKLCKYDKEHEPGELWNGVINMEYK